MSTKDIYKTNSIPRAMRDHDAMIDLRPFRGNIKRWPFIVLYVNPTPPFQKMLIDVGVKGL
jgi:hypothetical protein